MSGSRAASPGVPILIVDDHELFSTTLTMALRGEGFDARALAVSDLTDLLDGPAPERAGLAVLDLDLGRDAEGRYVSGVDAVSGLRGHGWRVLVVSGSRDTPGIAAAVAAGAVGSVPKSASFGALLAAVVTVAGGGSVMSEVEHQDWLARHWWYRARERDLARRLSRLSEREREVLELLAEGRRAAAIAEHFVVSMPTVRTQIRSVLAKLEVGSQLEAVALVRQSAGPPEPPAREA